MDSMQSVFTLFSQTCPLNDVENIFVWESIIAVLIVQKLFQLYKIWKFELHSLQKCPLSQTLDRRGKGLAHAVAVIYGLQCMTSLYCFTVKSKSLSTRRLHNSA